MARSWSERARRDFREREEYRKRNGEKDRYEKKDSRDDDREERGDRKETARQREEEAREDRREERGYRDDEWDDDYMNDLMQIRNAGPDDDVDDTLERLRSRYDYYERELDRYDADYDDLMAKYDRLRKDNQRYMLREGREIDRQQDKDIKSDGEIKDFDDLFKEREG